MDSIFGDSENFSVSTKAGNRTYFFDVRTNRKGDFFLTICESKKVYNDAGQIGYEKSKIYLYQEAFVDFIKGYERAIDYIKTCKPEYFIPKPATEDMFEKDIDDETVKNVEPETEENEDYEDKP